MAEMMIHLNYLAGCYQKYFNLLENGHTGKKARLLTGLKDPLLFQIACLTDNLNLIDL
jgi:hypothetical protein